MYGCELSLLVVANGLEPGACREARVGPTKLAYRSHIANSCQVMIHFAWESSAALAGDKSDCCFVCARSGACMH